MNPRVLLAALAPLLMSFPARAGAEPEPSPRPAEYPPPFSRWPARELPPRALPEADARALAAAEERRERRRAKRLAVRP